MLAQGKQIDSASKCLNFSAARRLGRAIKTSARPAKEKGPDSFRIEA